MKREDTIDYHIKATWHAIARMYNAEASQYALTVSVGYILLNIDLDKGTPATKIAPLLGLEARSITRTLKNMEEVGFIFKVQDDKDRRFFRIFLTEKGKIAREHARETVLKFNEAVLAQIPQNDIDNFFQVITQINQIIDQLVPKNASLPEIVEDLP